MENNQRFTIKQLIDNLNNLLSKFELKEKD